MTRNGRLRWLLNQAPADRQRALMSLSEREQKELNWHWRLWARAEQVAPPGDWRVWVIMAGRGFGKTRAGAEWVREVTSADPAARIALLGASLGEARAVTGLDCVGVLAAALNAIGRKAPLPNAYRLRSRAIPNLPGIARRCGLSPASGPAEAGDVLLARIGSYQFHVLITARDDRFIHAHAGLGRVVIGPLQQDWTVTSHWRLAPAN